MRSENWFLFKNQEKLQFIKEFLLGINLETTFYLFFKKVHQNNSQIFEQEMKNLFKVKRSAIENMKKIL